MASATNNDEKTMATDLIVSGADEPDRRPPQREEKDEQRHGFFTIYKKGQGYWTRICSAAAAGMIILLTANFIWVNLPPLIRDYFESPTATTAEISVAETKITRLTLAVCAVFVLGSAWLVWKLMNKPANADFLIATDSEMKKVNWTSKQELIGSTKVVIIFMLMIALLLFTLDMYFTRVFYLLNVLETDSPLWIWARAGLGAPAAVGLDIVMGVVIFGGAAWAIYETVRSK